MKFYRAHVIFAVVGAVLVGLPGTLFFGWFALTVPVFHLDMLFAPDFPLPYALFLLGASLAGLVGIASYWASLLMFKNGFVSGRGRKLVITGLGAGILASIFVVLELWFFPILSPPTLAILALVVLAIHAGYLVWKLPLARSATEKSLQPDSG